MTHRFKPLSPFIHPDIIHSDHHGTQAWHNTDSNRPYARFHEYDQSGRLTGIYYQEDGKPPHPRNRIATYPDDSMLPSAIWLCKNGMTDMFFNFKYNKYNRLDTLYFYGEGGNLHNEFHYKTGRQSVSIYSGNHIVSKSVSPCIFINGYRSPYIVSLPDISDVSKFYNPYEQERPGLYLCSTLRYFLGINETIMADTSPTSRPRD